MLFNSIEFLIFLPLVFLIHWFACKSGRSKNLFLIAASYLFYGWWNMKLLALIFLVTIAAYGAGIAIDSPKASPRSRKFMLVTSIIINIGTLVAFKYFDFFAESFTKVLQAAGLSPDIPTLNLILPVGISFYSFQAMSYAIDVYRRKISATHDPAAFFVFISFFPQLVAGPIERASNILPQFLRNRRRFTYKRGVEGMQLILWGLFKKMVVADNAAVIVNQIFADPQDVGTINLWIGALLFTFQIYGDFSGYSDIAIGTSRLFGIDLMKNFSLPYFSRDIAEFWRKWHISLTTWFRDYLYIPPRRKPQREDKNNRQHSRRVSGERALARRQFHICGLGCISCTPFHPPRDSRQKQTVHCAELFKRAPAISGIRSNGNHIPPCDDRVGYLPCRICHTRRLIHSRHVQPLLPRPLCDGETAAIMDCTARSH